MPNQTIFQTFARGKLLLSGEYFVLDGAVGLAIPVRFGQSLEVCPANDEGVLLWQSLEPDGQVWFEAQLQLPSLSIQATSDDTTAITLQSLLQACRHQNPAFLQQKSGLTVKTQVDFNRAWGLGTSSTVIAALAQWANCNPYLVLEETLGGSGYDLACAFVKGPILYQRIQQESIVQPVEFAPPFAEHLYFVYLGKKQNSREGIARYREFRQELSPKIAQITEISQQMLQARRLSEFEDLIAKHETLIAQALQIPRAKDLFFADFEGEIKSLGAWGGDFVLATSHQDTNTTKDYFTQKGFPNTLTWAEMFNF